MADPTPAPVAQPPDSEDIGAPALRTVLVAQAPFSEDLGSFGRAQYMLIRQCDFPHTYEVDEAHLSADSDRLSTWDYEYTRACFQRHTGRGEMALAEWVRKTSATKLLAFCTDILKAHPRGTPWTGCRVPGTVNVSNGFVVWTIEAFAKRPGSRTRVYSGDTAPNIAPRPLDVWGRP